MFVALDFTTQSQLSSQAVFPSSSQSPHTILFPNSRGHHQTNSFDPLQKEKPHVQNPPETPPPLRSSRRDAPASGVS